MTAEPVVVGVDGSDGSLRALEWAALEAERRKAPLRIVSVPTMPARMHAEQGTVPTVATEIREFSERAIDTAVTRSKEIAPGLVVDTALLSGAPAVAIADTGPQALMIVVGARGVGGFSAMLLGSVSRYVAMHAACPVVVIREQADAVHREIVVGAHDTNAGTQALAFGFEQAALCGAELVVVHALQRGEGHAGDQDATLAQATRALEETLADWKDRYPGVVIRPDLVRGHPAQVLSEYSARADLVVIGRHGGSSRPAVGSIQHAVLHHARGPVAIVPSRD
jgi:nucleotide-binding universal stress UspA family protein